MRTPLIRVPTVYVVRWDERNIVKVGFSAARRWRAFTSQGARIMQLIEFDHHSDAFVIEAALHERMRLIAPFAFSSRGAAQQFLGGRGDGWVECYLDPDCHISRVLDELRMEAGQ